MPGPKPGALPLGDVPLHECKNDYIIEVPRDASLLDFAHRSEQFEDSLVAYYLEAGTRSAKSDSH